MKLMKFGKAEAPSCGVVALSDWMTMPDGQSYQSIFADRWEILTDQSVAKTVPGFRSAEHWSLAAVLNGVVQVLIPGCRVQSWAYCEKPPKVNSCWVVK